MRWTLRATVPCLLGLLLVAPGCGGGSSPSSSSIFTSEKHVGGEASIEEFGSEANGAERAAIEGSFHAYLNDLARENFEDACAQLATEVRRSLEQLVPKDPSVGRGCAAILPRLLSPQAPKIARAQAKGKIAKVRAQGDRGFVVFRAPGAKLYQMTMAREGGRWKAATGAASVLVPSAATLGQ